MAELESASRRRARPQPRLQELFGSGLISKDDKLAMLDRMFGGQASTTSLNVAQSAGPARPAGHDSRRGRRGAQAVARRGRAGMPVELETANPLTPELEQEILAALSKVLGADPIVSARVNPDLIAGFVIRVGDRVYDGSVRTRLEQMRKGMIARATEAIQTTPREVFQYRGITHRSGFPA